jgi:hypothetical protein
VVAPVQRPKDSPDSHLGPLRRAATRPHPPGLPSGLQYIDELGFDWSEIPAHRKELCDHCFLDEPTSTVVSPCEDWFTNRFTWPTLTATATPADATDHLVALGPPNGTTWTIQPGRSATFGEPRRQTCLDLAELLRADTVIAGDVPDWRTLIHAHVIAFERHGGAPGPQRRLGKLFVHLHRWGLHRDGELGRTCRGPPRPRTSWPTAASEAPTTSEHLGSSLHPPTPRSASRK